MEHQNKFLVLTRLGLTSSQAKVYLALLHSGMSTAKTISKNSGIARSDVYRVMASFEGLGLVERIVSAPCKFRAISIQDALAILLQRRIKETSELQNITRKILKTNKNDNARQALEESEIQFSLFYEQAAVRRKQKTLDNVQRSFDEVTTWRNPHAALFIQMKEIVGALQRGVEIRVIVDTPDDTEKIVSDTIQQLKEYPKFKIRYLPKTPKALISLYDKQKAWICTRTNPWLKESTTLRTKNPCLLSIVQDYFEIMWLTAMEFKPEHP